jgi:hypothetical protein
MKDEKLKFSKRFTKFSFSLLLLGMFLFTGTLALSGCGGGGGTTGGGSASSQTYTVTPTGGPAVKGAKVMMYELGNTVDITCPQTSSGSGSYTCTVSPVPSSSTPLYITVTGGSGSSVGSNVVMTNLITPNIISNKSYSTIPVNELTTVAATDALKQAGFTGVSNGNAPVPPAATKLSTAINEAADNIASIANGVHFTNNNGTAGNVTSAAATSNNATQIESLVNVLDTLANDLSECVSSSTSTTCTTMLSDGGVSTTSGGGTILNIVVNVYNNNSSVSTGKLTSDASTSSSPEFNSGTTETPIVAPLQNIAIPSSTSMTTPSMTTTPTSGISAAVMYQYNTSGTSGDTVNEYSIDTTTGVITASPQSVATGEGVSGLVFNKNNSYAYAIDSSDNIWVYSAVNGILTKDAEYSLSQYLTSANYNSLPSGYPGTTANGLLDTNLNTLYVNLPSTSKYGSTIIFIPINSDGSLNVSGEIQIPDYQGNYHFYNYNNTNSFYGNVVLETYDPSVGSYELNAYSVNSSGMISSAPISTPIKFATVSSTNTFSPPLVSYIPYAPNGGFYFAYTFGNNTGGAGIYKFTYGSNGQLTGTSGNITTNNGSTSLFNNVVVPNQSYLYYTDNAGNIYLCNNTSSSISCSETEPALSYIPSGDSVYNGEDSLFFVRNTLYASALLSTGSTYTWQLFPFTIGNDGSLTSLPSVVGNISSGGKGGFYAVGFPVNHIISFYPLTNQSQLYAYQVDTSGLIESSNPVKSAFSNNVGDDWENGNFITYNNTSSVSTSTIYDYLFSGASGMLNQVGNATTLSNVNYLASTVQFPFPFLPSNLSPDTNYIANVFCSEVENACRFEPLQAIYGYGYNSSNTNLGFYGIQITSSSLTAMNSGGAIIPANASSANIQIYEFFYSGYPSSIV